VISGTNTYSVQHTLVIYSLPTITLAQSSLTTCITSNIPLYSKPINLTAAGGTSYKWNPPFNPLAGNPNGPVNTVRPAMNFCYSVTGQDANGCKATAVTCITVIPRFNIQVSPIYTLICRSLDIHEYAVLEAKMPSSPAVGIPASHSYSWTGGIIGGILTSPFSSTVAVSPSAINTYTAEMLDSLNCVSLPGLSIVDIENCTDISENSVNYNFLMHPNPVSDKLTIELKAIEHEKISLSIFNFLGQIVYSVKELSQKRELDVSFLPGGIYFLNLQSNSKQKTVKFIKE
jgi:hypothetical protein